MALHPTPKAGAPPGRPWGGGMEASSELRSESGQFCSQSQRKEKKVPEPPVLTSYFPLQPGDGGTLRRKPAFPCDSLDSRLGSRPTCAVPCGTHAQEHTAQA